MVNLCHTACRPNFSGVFWGSFFPADLFFFPADLFFSKERHTHNSQPGLNGSTHWMEAHWSGCGWEPVAQVDRVVDDYTAVAKNLVSKDGDVSRFVGMRIHYQPQAMLENAQSTALVLC